MPESADDKFTRGGPSGDRDSSIWPFSELTALWVLAPTIQVDPKPFKIVLEYLALWRNENKEEILVVGKKNSIRLGVFPFGRGLVELLNPGIYL